MEKELMSDDNKYDAGKFGKQDAERGVDFLRFPNVLCLQLKRFEYDAVRCCMAKVNDHYQFAKRLNVKPFLKPKEREDNDDDDVPVPPLEEEEACTEYVLYAILIHSGGVHSGHYYAFLRPFLGDPQCDRGSVGNKEKGPDPDPDPDPDPESKRRRITEAHQGETSTPTPPPPPTTPPPPSPPSMRCTSPSQVDEFGRDHGVPLKGYSNNNKKKNEGHLPSQRVSSIPYPHRIP